MSPQPTPQSSKGGENVENDLNNIAPHSKEGSCNAKLNIVNSKKVNGGATNFSIALYDTLIYREIVNRNNATPKMNVCILNPIQFCYAK